MYIVAYLTYLFITIGCTMWVGSTLRRNGRVFLIEAFHGDSDLADSVNALLVVGFYLVSFGFVALGLRTTEDLQTARQAIETVCDRLGVVLLGLGLMHFSNLYLFDHLRRRSRGRDRERLDRHHPEHAALGRVLD